MTTAAFDGKTLAADTLAHGSIILKVHKLHRLPDGAMFAAAGAVVHQDGQATRQIDLLRDESGRLAGAE